MIFAFDCTDCSSIKQILCRRLCGPSEIFFSGRRRVREHTYTQTRHWIIPIDMHGFVAAMIYFLFQSSFQRITLVLSFHLKISSSRWLRWLRTTNSHFDLVETVFFSSLLHRATLISSDLFLPTCETFHKIAMKSWTRRYKLRRKHAFDCPISFDWFRRNTWQRLT